MSEKEPPTLPDEVYRERDGERWLLLTLKSDGDARCTAVLGGAGEVFVPSRRLLIAWAMSERARAEKAEKIAAAERALRKAEANAAMRRYEAGTALYDAAVLRLGECRASLRALGVDP